MKIAVDWDDTLVDVRTQEWLPGALERLRELAVQHDVFIHTCRANWPEGHASVQAKLADAGLHLEVIGKPLADVYIDDRAEKPDWATLEVSRGRARNAHAARKAYGRTVNGIVVY